MENSLAKSLLLLFALIYLAWQYLTASQQVIGQPNEQELKQALFMPALVMTLSLAANGLAFMQEAYILNEFGFAEEPSKFNLLRDQFSILVGTGCLFEVVRRALQIRIGEGERPQVVGLRVQITMYRRLFKKHLWAVLGMGMVFGIASGPGMALFLGGELALMWLGASFFLHYFKHRL